MSDYRVLPIPAEFRGPSGEPHQVQLNGRVRKVSLFHGRADEEFDWHIYFSLPFDMARRMQQFLRENGESIADEDVAEPYCELMIIDDWHRRGITWPPWQASLQRKYDTADLTRPLRLIKSGSNHAAYDLGREVADEPGENKDLSESSRLYLHRGRIYIQGLLVADVGHSPHKLEIHPPDSIAFAIGDESRTLNETEFDATWPAKTIRWRVAWFGNSAHHRVNNELPLKQRRTTTWYLPLPGRVEDAPFPPRPPTVPFTHYDITTEEIPLWNSKTDEWYDRRGVSAIEEARLEIDPRDNRQKLRVNATMEVPGNRGGLIVRDYVVQLRPDVFDPGSGVEL